MKRRMLSLCLALIMAIGFIACVKPVATAVAEAQTTSGTYPDYLNLDSWAPIIKNGYEDQVKLKLAYVGPAACGEWMETWFGNYLKARFNLEFELTRIDPTVAQSQIQLLFTSDELPDIMLNFGLTSNQLVQYAIKEGLFLKVDEYITEELAPNLKKYLIDNENCNLLVTLPDGHIYDMPYLYDINNEALYGWIFINKTDIEEIVCEVPTTLDDYIDVMYKLKEAHSADEKPYYPQNGSHSDWTYGMGAYLLNALGYNISNTEACVGIEPTIRDGEVVIPVYDMDVYKEWLSLFHQFWEDGIIYQDIDDHDNYWTWVFDERTATFSSAPPYVIGASGDIWGQYVSAIPLTSDYREESYWWPGSAGGIGNFQIAASTKYPELCVRIADMFFNDNDGISSSFMYGVGSDSEWALGFAQNDYNPETDTFVRNTEMMGDLTETEYFNQKWAPNYWLFGSYALPEATYNLKVWEGYNPIRPEDKIYDVNNGDSFARMTTKENIMPYIGTADSIFPRVYYVEEAVAQQIMNLLTVIEPYVREQNALFVTGQRDLSEVYDYQAELKDMGIEDLLEIYKNIYNK